MDIIRLILDGVLVLTSLFLVLLILMHKGRGGGLSDMFGGGISATGGSSTVAERNLNRITVGMALAWFATVVALGIIK
ncbi:preprotein translocase subunit SecG [Kytococcus sedentarius]|uniref:preprotein translocase subunit SecG n=1 Tax=Kytococcus sedentarius TaxID=1276 RepID=UPI0035BC08B8